VVDNGRMRRLGLVSISVVLGLGAGSVLAACGTAAHETGPCQLGNVELVPATGPPPSGQAVVADLTSRNGMSGNVPSTSLTVYANGDAVALGTGGARHARLDEAGLARLSECVDRSGFLDLADDYPEQASKADQGGQFCGVSDASTETVTARSSSGIGKVVNAYDLAGQGSDGDGCDLGHPMALTDVYRGLSDLRARIVEIGSPS